MPEGNKTAQTGRIAVVTGAAGPMGYITAQRLHQDGFHVLLVDRDPNVDARATALCEGDGSAVGYQLDLSRLDAIKDFIHTVEREYARCDALINLAGINLDNADGTKIFTEDITDDAWDLMLNVNLRAPFALCRGFLPGMKSRGWGRIVNVASRAGRTYIPASNAHYSASKAGLIGMTRLIAGESGTFGITANCIAPGRITSPLADRQSPEIIAQSMKGIPLARVGQPNEIADTVRFLCSDGAAYITGSTIDVNGGSFMN